MTTEDVELLGVKDIIDKQFLQAKQYMDLISQEYPPSADADTSEPVSSPVPEPEPPVFAFAVPALVPVLLGPPELGTAPPFVFS